MIAVAAAALVICNLAEKCIFKQGIIFLIVLRGISCMNLQLGQRYRLSPRPSFLFYAVKENSS